MSHSLLPEPNATLAKRRRALAPKVMIGDMASGIAHDFRNLLAVLQSALGMMERHLGEPERARPLLAAARQSLDRGINLTARLLALARPHDLELRMLKLTDLIRDFSPFLRFALGPRIRLRFRLNEDMPHCSVDPYQFNAALLNLVVNARDAMPDGGEITIETDLASAPGTFTDDSRTSDWLRVSVRDDGIGMSKETAAHIFEPWFTTKGDSGTGLGLPQVAAFLKVSGGMVSVRSRPAEGTIIDLYFPLPRVAAAADLDRQVDRWINEGGSFSGWLPSHAAP